MYATTDEVISVAEGLKKYGAIYATHMRSEGEAIVEAMDETFLSADPYKELHLVKELTTTTTQGRGSFVLDEVERFGGSEGVALAEPGRSSGLLSSRSQRGVARKCLRRSTPQEPDFRFASVRRSDNLDRSSSTRSSDR